MIVPEQLYGCDLELIKKYWTVKPGDVCMDIGFGPGCWSIFAAVNGGFVYAFDPKPHAVTVLLNTLFAYKIPNCCVLPMGVWDSTGTVPFSIKNSQFDPENGETDFAVTTLDDFVHGFALGRLDYINMDSEGAELKTVRAGLKTLAKFKPTVVIEVHDPDFYHEIQCLMKPLGYKFERTGQFLIALPNK